MWPNINAKNLTLDLQAKQAQLQKFGNVSERSSLSNKNKHCIFSLSTRGGIAQLVFFYGQVSVWSISVTATQCNALVKHLCPWLHSVSGLQM